MVSWKIRRNITNYYKIGLSQNSIYDDGSSSVSLFILELLYVLRAREALEGEWEVCNLVVCDWFLSFFYPFSEKRWNSVKFKLFFFFLSVALLNSYL